MGINQVLILLSGLAILHIALAWILALHRGLSARRSDTVVTGTLPGPLLPVSVIVPAWNESGTIEKNITALKQVEYPSWEALIVAGGEDGTYQAAVMAVSVDDRFRVLERGPEPKNTALNKGIQAARYDTLVLLDADNIVEPGWLAALVAPIAGGASVSVGNSFPNTITWITLEEEIRHIYTYQVLKRSWIQGDRSIAIRRDLLERIGGLPVHTFAREDWDIWARLEPLGVRIAFAGGARLVTDRPSTIRESWVHQLRWRRTHLAGMWEHHGELSKLPLKLFRQLYGYLLSTAVTLLLLVALISLLFFPGWSPSLFSLLALIIVWLCLRQAAVAAAVAAYTGDWVWLARTWMLGLNMFLTIPASIVALFSPGKQKSLYKGPRHEI